MEPVFAKLKQQLESSLEALGREFGKLRTGRATPGLLDEVRAEVYGQQMPINQLASISVPDAKTLRIAPYDANSLGAIEKAIQKSNIGVTPQNDGKVIHISMPPLTEERRKEYVKLAKQHTEECRVSQRNARHQALDSLKNMEKDKKISQDDHKRGSAEVQKLMDDYGKKVDATYKRKEEEILKV